MTNSLLIGIVAVVILAGGGYWIYSANQSSDVAVIETPATTDTDTSAPVVSAKAASVPVVTTNANVSPSSATAVVIGDVTPNGAQTSYWYEYGKTEALGTNTTPQAIGSGWIQIPSPAYITGLSANTKYFFRLSAQNSLGTVVGTTHSFMTNSTPPSPGTAPSARTENASDVARTAATANGQVNPNNFATTVWFEYGETTNFGNASALQGMGQGSSLTVAVAHLSNLNPLTKYYFRINAQNQYGTVNGTTKSFTTSGPAASTAPSVSTSAATSVATSSAVLNGKVNPNGDSTTYWFEYGMDSLLGNVLGTTTNTAVAGTGTVSVNAAATLTKLTRNTRYYFRIVAQNSHGTTKSTIVNFKTKP
jgi:phosphodiesterase/alkaline phosphatase D-like protein